MGSERAWSRWWRASRLRRPKSRAFGNGFSRPSRFAQWDADALFARVARYAERRLPGIEALVIDDTGFPKQPSLHLAGEHGGACIGMRLYLPADGCEDSKRRTKAGVLDDVEFERKWKIALGLIDRALEAGTEKRPVLADAGYGVWRHPVHRRRCDHLATEGTPVS